MGRSKINKTAASSDKSSAATTGVTMIHITNPEDALPADYVANWSIEHSILGDRYLRALKLLYYTKVHKDDYIAIVCRIHRKSPAVSVIYAIIYAYQPSSRGFAGVSPGHNSDKLRYDYIAIHPSFMSADGEYRRRFIDFSQFFFVMNTFMPALESLEDHILSEIEAGMQLTVDIMCPTGIDIKSIQTDVDARRLSLLSYMAAWMLDMPRRETIENHISSKYLMAMFSKEDIAYYKKHGVKHPDPAFEYLLTVNVMALANNKYQQLGVNMGQKIIPLTVNEIANIDDIRYNTWLETQINSHVTDLVLNAVSPTFAMSGDWFLIQNANRELYDNPIMQSRMDYSDIAKRILGELDEARKHTFIIDPATNKERFISFHMHGMANAIDIPIEYAESHLIISDTALCIIGEYVGRTAADIKSIYDHDPHFSSHYGPIFTSVKWFGRYLLDILYGCHCLNTKLGLIHGDLHLNNFTFNLTEIAGHVIQSAKYARQESAYIVYTIAGEHYALPQLGAYSCIIDFSRAIIGQTSPILANETNTMFHTPTDLIMREQADKIWAIYRRDLPDFANEYADLLHAALISFNDDLKYAIFRLFSAIDAYKLSSSWISMLRDISDIVIAPEIFNLLDDIKDMAYSYLTSDMLALLQQPQRAHLALCGETPMPRAANEWPITHIIRRYFAEYALDKVSAEGFVLLGYYADGNNLNYNMREESQWPPNSYKNIKLSDNDNQRATDYAKYLKAGAISERIESIKHSQSTHKSPEEQDQKTNDYYNT